jgi:hypothetical protein
MPTAIALRSFDHSGPVRKGDTVTFDAITIKALQRSGLVSKETGEDPKPDPVTKPEAPPKAGKKSAASQAVQASPPPIAPPPLAGALPPPPPVK